MQIETITTGHRAIGSIDQRNGGFVATSTAIGHLPAKATIQEARTLLFEMDKAIQHRDEMKVLYAALYDAHERAMTGQGHLVDLKELQNTRLAYEQAERLIAELAGQIHE
jgi:hypothetical protein